MSNHLTRTDRALIEKYIAQGFSLTEIAERLSRHVSTISREIIANRKFLFFESKSAYSYCIKYGTCRKHHVKNDGECHFCREFCKHCTRFDCTKYCSDYVSSKCSKLSKPPYVCTNCEEKPTCKRNHAYYSANIAQDNSEVRLHRSRQHPQTSTEERARIRDIIVPLLQKGQSINHIMANHGDEIGLSERTIYNYIERGAFRINNLDLPEKVRYRRRKANTAISKRAYKNRIGRDYDSYLLYMREHPNTHVVEMDTVVGKKDGTKKVLLTLIFTDKGFMPVFLLPGATQSSVLAVLDHLTMVLGVETFRTLFPVILTDNGGEFKDATRIEMAPNGERRTRVFYCDPQASWQKPHVERNHHLIRKILPKGTSFRLLTEEDTHKITCHINSFAKERFNNQTPIELMMDDPVTKKLLDAMSYTLIPPDDVCLRPALLRKDI